MCFHARVAEGSTASRGDPVGRPCCYQVTCNHVHVLAYDRSIACTGQTKMIASVVVFGFGGVGQAVIQGDRIAGMARLDAQFTNPAFGILYDHKMIKGSEYGFAQVRCDFPRFVELIESGRIDTSSMVSKRIKLDQVNDAFRARCVSGTRRRVLNYRVYRWVPSISWVIE